MTKTLAFIILLLLPVTSAGQVSIRMFARTRPVTVVFTPVKGEFILNDGKINDLKIPVNETVAITRHDDMIIYRTLSGISSVTDSLSIEPLTGRCSFHSAGSRQERRTEDPRRQSQGEVLPRVTAGT